MMYTLLFYIMYGNKLTLDMFDVFVDCECGSSGQGSSRVRVGLLYI